MKRLIVLPLLLLFAGTIYAQNLFTVPERTDAYKHDRAVYLGSIMIVNSISFAKSLGHTVEDIAKFTGEQFKVSWNKEAGFESFVWGTLNNWVCMIPSESEIQIMEQSEEMIKFSISAVYPGLYEAGSLYNVSYEEYLKWNIIVSKIIGDYLGSTYSHEAKEGALTITVKKK